MFHLVCLFVCFLLFVFLHVMIPSTTRSGSADPSIFVSLSVWFVKKIFYFRTSYIFLVSRGSEGVGLFLAKDVFHAWIFHMHIFVFFSHVFDVFFDVH